MGAVRLRRWKASKNTKQKTGRKKQTNNNRHSKQTFLRLREEKKERNDAIRSIMYSKNITTLEKIRKNRKKYTYLFKIPSSVLQKKTKRKIHFYSKSKFQESRLILPFHY